MTYQQAERLRGKSFGSLLGEQEGGLGESLRKTLSLKSKARMTGIKERFDPLNIAKFLTGGSNFAPAALGKLFGRSKEDISRFSGSKLRDVSGTATKIGSLESENETLSILLKIYELMRKSNEDKIAQRDAENAFAEENKLEKDRQHKALIAAITGKPYAGDLNKSTASKVTDTPSPNLFGDLLDVFGLGRDALSILKTVGKMALFFTGPVGAAILGATAVGALVYGLYKMFSNKESFEDPTSEVNKGLDQAREMGGLAGVKDEAERRKKLPEYERTMAEIQDFQQYQNEGDKLNDQQLQGFAKRGPGALEAVEDYKKQRDTYEKISGIKTPEPITSSPSSAPAPSSPMSEPPAVESSSTGQALSAAQSQNLDLNIPESNTDPATVVNNNSVKSYDKTGTKIPMPSVRNQEPTFANMILYSTRVV